MDPRRKSVERSQKEHSTGGKPQSQASGVQAWSKTPEPIGHSNIEKLQKSRSPIRLDRDEDRNKLRNIELKITRYLQDADRRAKKLQPLEDPFAQAQRVRQTTRLLFAGYNRQFPSS